MNRYEQLRKLGSGAYGEAILAKRKNDGKLVVIKQVRLTKLKPADRAAAFQEATVLAAMHHPFIVSYVDQFEESNCLYIVMEYADGGDLAGKLANRGGKLFSEDEVLKMFIQIAVALNYVHSKHILHRDLKTQNVFLMKDGTIKLGDFGIAKVLQHTFQLAQTRIGTPYYLSPEICEGKGYNSKTDVWSLGCILYELCTLKHAFQADNMNALLMNIIRGKVAPIPGKFSPEMRSLVESLLKKDPAQRPSMSQVLKMPFIKARLSEFLSNCLASYEHEHMEMSGKAPFAEKASKLKVEKSKVDEQRMLQRQRQMMAEAQRRQEEAELRRRRQAKEEEEQRRQLINDMYMRQREEVMENKRRAQRDIWGHNPVFDMQEPGAEEERYPKDRRGSKQEIDLEERKRLAREQREAARRNRERALALEQEGSVEAFKGLYNGDDSRSSEDSPKPLKKRAPTMDDNDMKEMQRQLRQEARQNREKQMAAAKDLDMDKLVAEAEAEQRKERRRLKRAKSTDPAKKPKSGEIDMDKLVAEAEAEMKRKKEKGKEDPAVRKIEDHEKIMDVVYQQASAIMEALEMKDNDTSTTEEAAPATPFIVDDQELNFPEVKDSDSLTYRSEAMRAYLEKKLGLEKMISLCNLMTSDTAKPEEVEKELANIDSAVVVLLQQLIILDEQANH